jgi:fructose/tagatose bisphosphate aldolase
MPEARRVIIIHTLEHARAALEAASEARMPVIVQSAPDAIHYAGSLYLLTLFRQARHSVPDADAIFILDADAAAAEAISAMQMGHTHLRSNAQSGLAGKISDIAAQLGVVMIAGEYEALDLLRHHDAKEACRKWLLALE